MLATAIVTRRRVQAFHALLGAALLLAACESLGPTTIPRDRFDYSGAVAESWKSQTLLNMVKMRYYDLPIYLDVAQIVSGYTAETSINANGQVARAKQGDTFLGFGATGTFTDRPTITYTPLTGQKYLESFLNPIPLAKVFALVQAGFPAELVLELGTDSLGGLRNRPISPDATHEASAGYFRVLVLLRELQDAGAMGLRVERKDKGEPVISLYFPQDRVPSAILAKAAEVRRLLRLDPSLSSFRLVQSPLPGGPGELSVATRSLISALFALSLGVEVPPEHQARRLAPAVPDVPPGYIPLVTVHSGPSRPQDAFAAVSYEGAWFWVANDDWKSKRTFTGILFLFTLADTSSASLPVITIPTQ